MQPTHDPPNALAPIPHRLPLLALRHLLLSPGMLLPLFVGAPHELDAIESARQCGNFLFLALSRAPEQSVPRPADIYPAGCVGVLLDTSPQVDGRRKILVQGVARASIEEFLQAEPFFRVTLRLHEDSCAPGPADGATAQLMGHVRANAERLFFLRGMHTADAETLLASATTPERLADLLLPSLELEPAERQALLTTSDHLARLEQVSDLLEGQVKQLQVTAEIRCEADAALERRQRERLLREQLRVIRRELGEMDEEDDIGLYRARIAAANMAREAQQEALRQLRRLQQMHADAAEASVIRCYLDWLVEMPWQRSTSDLLDLQAARQVLDRNHHDMEPIKERILEFLGVCQLKRHIKGPILCLVGPPGVGKTSLGRSIAQAMGRKFVRIALGGLKDEAEIRGHRRTYLGALPGRIIQGIRTVGSNNPVFMLDEIDKVGSDFRGDPAAALLEVLDPEHNQAFSDHYLNVPFDLSRVLFIATANTTDSIPRTLLDRMEILALSGYTEREKVAIAQRHLLPRQIEEHGLATGSVKIGAATLVDIIQGYTRESGLRGLERQLARLCRKAAKRVAAGERGPFVIQRRSLPFYLGPRHHLRELEGEEQAEGVALALAWTPHGGEVLRIEALVMPGKGNLILTGQLGEVMKESAHAALSYLRSRSLELGLGADCTAELDIHVHVPSGAIPKDGPSAGMTLTTALASALCRRPVRMRLAMTGEISLQGKILPVGGLREKALAALRTRLATVLIPKANEREVRELPGYLRQRLQFVPVSHLDEVLAHALVPAGEGVGAAAERNCRGDGMKGGRCRAQD